MTETLTPPATAVYTVPQERRIVTEVPGPKSRELHARREAVVAAATEALAAL